jgi:hypothetical protein
MNATNISPISFDPFNQDNPNQYFNNLVLPPMNVTQNVNDAIQAFFERITENSMSASILASAVVYTAISQSMDPMVALQQFQRVPPGEINQYLAMFLNLNRVGTSLLGLNNVPTVNQYVYRAIML